MLEKLLKMRQAQEMDEEIFLFITKRKKCSAPHIHGLNVYIDVD